jgi:CubicO group peptidase (beta-lactamase class C family)
MKTRRVQAAIVLLGLLILPAHANDQLPSPSLVSWIDAQMGASGIPGASVAVVKDYEIKWAAGFGTSNKANGRKVTSATLFQACSISKPVTAIAAMIALDQKRLEVDRDVNAILDEFSSQSDFGRWKLQSRYSTPVTLRMLLSHTGGTNDFRYSGYRYGYYRHPPAPINEIPTMREELDGLPPAKTPAITVSREPGATWVYSPAGYTVIQAILTSLYGKPFPGIMDALVLTPLGLHDSTFSQPTPPDLTPRMAVPYIPDGTPLPDGPRVFNTSASGGLTTTPTDLAKLMIAFQKALAGRAEQGLTPEIARSMMVRQPGETRAGECFGSSDPAKVACRSSWGLGFDVNLTKDFEHRPDGDPTGPYFGHSGFNSGYLALMLGSKTGGHGVVVMVNVAPEDMSGPAPQFTFLTGLVRQVAAEEQWP